MNKLECIELSERPRTERTRKMMNLILIICQVTLQNSLVFYDLLAGRYVHVAHNILQQGKNWISLLYIPQSKLTIFSFIYILLSF